MNSSSPLYMQVYNSIARDIYKGQYPFGSELPNMKEIAEKYKVSAITVRAAFHELCEKRLITVSQGKEARVIFDNCAERTMGTYFRWLAERRDAISEIYELGRIVVPPFIVIGARACDDRAVERLCVIRDCSSQAKKSMQYNLEILTEFLMCIAVQTKNRVAINLFEQVDDFIKIPLVTSFDDKAVSDDMCRQSTEFMGRIIELISLCEFDGIYTYVKSKLDEILYLFGVYVKESTNGINPESKVSFEWSLEQQKSYKYTKIADDLILKIMCCEYENGQLLPSEARLREIYGASTMTVRRAMKIVSSEQMIRTNQGQGSVVALNKSGISKNGPRYMRLVMGLPRHAEVLQILQVSLPELARTAFCKSREELETAADESMAQINGKYMWAGMSIVKSMVEKLPNKAVREIYMQLLRDVSRHNLLCTFFEQSMPDYRGKFAEMLVQTRLAVKSGDYCKFLDGVSQMVKLVAAANAAFAAENEIFFDLTEI
ncbi:MAG: GntR family transcriptional regulator [Oscillospiraceae bacterium]